MISVVIPLYNKEKQIGNTLRTVLNQTFQDFEIVVVNDGSTDNSAAEVEKFHDQRIRLVHQANAGVSAARNRGIEESKYDLIAFLDADDEWKPSYLETQRFLYKKYPECSVFACNYEFKDADGDVRPTIIRKLPFKGSDGVLSNYFEVASCSHPPLWPSAVMVKKEAILSVGGFRVGIRSGEDLLTWAWLAARYKITYCPQPLSIYFLDDDFSRQPVRKQDLGDPVGKSLTELQHTYHLPHIRRYISHWHKMRASTAIRYGERKETMYEIYKSLSSYPMNYKVVPFFFLALLPRKLQIYIISRHK